MLQDQTTASKDTLDRYRERLANFSNEFELGLFLFIMRRSIWWCLLFFAIAGAGAFLYLRYTQTIYESSTVLQVNTSNNANKVLNVQNIYELDDQQNELASAVELLRSQVFLKRVLQKLPLEVSYFAEGTFKINEHYKNSPYAVTEVVKSPEIYDRRIDIRFDDDGTQGELSYKNGSQSVAQRFKLGQAVDMPFASFVVTGDIPGIKRMLSGDGRNTNYYFVVNDIESLTESYFPRLNVQLINDAAKTVRISFRDNSARKTSDLVSAIAQEFIEYDVERRSEGAKNVLDFIDEQLESVYGRLKNSESDIDNFKKDHQIKDDEEEMKFYMERFGSIENQLTQVELEDRVLTEIEIKLNNPKGVNVSSLLSLLAGSEYQNNISAQLNTLYQLISQRDDALSRVKEDNDIIKSYNAQIEVQKKLLIESVKSIHEGVVSKKESLTEKINEYRTKMGSKPGDEAEYSGLQRLYSINEKFYTLLLEKKTEYQISKAGYTPQHVVLEKARTPFAPISPNRQLAFITSLLVAAVVCLALIIVRYIMHDTISSLNEISKLTNASISALGIIPRYRRDIPVSQLLVDKNPKSLIAEAFRSLRTNLQFIDNSEGPKVMAVTSTISGEGKTFVAINLAGIIAFSGKKVVILDLDMRKPKIHLGFGVQNLNGMSTILIGKNNIADCIQHSSLENLDFITAGPIPPNPAELIISNKMTEVIEELKKIYDMVIIDNPPVGLVTDGIAIIRMADYPIYIFRADYSRRNFIQIVDRLYNETGIKKLSIVLNGIDVDRQNYGYNYGYGYGYGHGYGYGYGYYDDQQQPAPKGPFKWLKRKRK